MACEKCSYNDKKEKEKFGKKLCKICFYFAPDNEDDFSRYLNEKLDWRILETFRKYPKNSLKKGMQDKAQQGKIVTRAPLGYDIVEGKLVPNETAAKVHSLFKTFLEKDYSLNSLAKNYGLSVNGIKKILANRAYIGEIKFAGQLIKSEHDSIVSPEIFYAVQRKLNEKLG